MTNATYADELNRFAELHRSKDQTRGKSRGPANRTRPFDRGEYRTDRQEFEKDRFNGYSTQNNYGLVDPVRDNLGRPIRRRRRENDLQDFIDRDSVSWNRVFWVSVVLVGIVISFFGTGTAIEVMKLHKEQTAQTAADKQLVEDLLRGKFD